MQRPYRIGPTLVDKAPIGVRYFRPKKGIVDPTFWRIDIEIGRHHVVVAREHDRR